MSLTGRATAETAMRGINDGAVSRFFTRPCNPADLTPADRASRQSACRG